MESVVAGRHQCVRGIGGIRHTGPAQSFHRCITLLVRFHHTSPIHFIFIMQSGNLES